MRLVDRGSRKPFREDGACVNAAGTSKESDFEDDFAGESDGAKAFALGARLEFFAIVRLYQTCP